MNLKSIQAACLSLDLQSMLYEIGIGDNSSAFLSPQGWFTVIFPCSEIPHRGVEFLVSALQAGSTFITKIFKSAARVAFLAYL